MPLRNLWPPWRARWVLLEDEDLLVVDKPTGVPTHAPSPERADDAHSRLLAWLRDRGVAKPYLGIHQRLDADTSGVLLFTRRREANASIAAQFEGRRVHKTYVAVVGAWRGQARGVLRHRVAPGEGGTMRALPPGARGGQLAVTRFRILERVGPRALVELIPETGRTHQLRVQLAAAGAPIVGDARYGGDAAHRLMLHAASLEIVHPSGGKALKLEAPAPAMLAASLRGQLGADLPRTSTEIAERMREAAERRYAIATSADTTALRLVNGGGDALPGVTVDAYDDYLVASLASDEAERARDQVLDAASLLEPRGVYVKLRPKHASVIVDARSEQYAPRAPVRGEAAPDALVIHELGLPFEVELGEGLSTGIFLDQRENRRRVREIAKDLRVLNLFAYTGAFTVAAAAGGALSTVSVDVSKSALGRARANLDRIGADPKRHELIEADVLPWLAAAGRAPARFDLVLLDPPSFATTKSSRFSADHDYVDVAAASMRVLAPRGRLLACTNHRGIVQAKLRRYLHEALRAAGRAASQMKDLPPPADFPAEPGFEPHLKSVLVTLT